MAKVSAYFKEEVREADAQGLARLRASYTRSIRQYSSFAQDCRDKRPCAGGTAQGWQALADEAQAKLDFINSL